MSASEHSLRSRKWLEEQLELLGNLRNATPRDPSFKLWRQNTLTVLQRIWPGEQARSERFRRIMFSPVSPKSDFKTTRDWYVRGCGEAVDLLRALLTEIDAIGVPEPGRGTSARPPVLAASRDDDFPVLELPTHAPSVSEPGGSDDLVLLDSDATAAALAPEHADQDASAPAPPKLRVDVKPSAPQSSAPELTPPSLPTRNGRSRAVSPSSDESMPSMPPSGTARPAAIPPAGTAKAKPAASSAAPTPPAPPRPPVARPGDRRTGPAERRTGPRASKTRRAQPKPKLKDLLGLPSGGEVAIPTVPAPPVNAPPPPEAPVVHAALDPAIVQEPRLEPAPPAPRAPVAAAPPQPAPEPPPVEREDPAQATADFMRNSPVLGLQGRPVVRASDATQFLDPDAVALATLASDIGRYVPDEAAREPLRLALVALATQVEAKSPEWSALRDLVGSAMAHPELAKRLMPLVLPWLGRAA